MVSPVSDSDLLKEIRALRERVEALEQGMRGRLRVTLEPISERAFFGQPVSIRATVTREDGGSPVSGAQVTLITTWGKLRSSGILEKQQGSSVTVRTDAEGTAQVILIPPSAEELQDSQQAAIETMLDLLDAKAATPRETQTGLNEMVRQYLWEANSLFREAVDIYFSQFPSRVADPVNESPRLDEWSFFDSAIMAFVQQTATGQDSGNSVQAAATLTLRFKDWLAPWLETYLDFANSQNAFLGDLAGTKDLGGDTSSLLDDLYDRINDFAANQRGAVGTYVGRKVAEKSLREFADSGIADLSLDTKVAISNSLTVTSDAIAKGGALALAGIKQSRANLSEEIDTKLSQGVTGSLAGFHDALNAAVTTSLQGFLESATKAKSDTLTDFQTDLITAKSDLFAGFKTEITDQLAGSLGSFKDDLGKVRNDGLSGFQNDVDRSRTNIFKQFQLDLNNARTKSFGDFQADVNKHKTDVFAGFQQDVNRARADSLTGFQNDAVKVRSDSLNVFQTSLNDARTASIKDFQSDIGKTRTQSLGEFQKDVDTVRSKIFKDFQTDVTKHRTDSLSGFQADVGQVRKDVFTGFQTDIGNTKTDNVKDFQNTLRTEAANLQLGTRITRLEGSVKTVNDNVSTLRNDFRRIRPNP